MTPSLEKGLKCIPKVCRFNKPLLLIEQSFLTSQAGAQQGNNFSP